VSAERLASAGVGTTVAQHRAPKLNNNANDKRQLSELNGLDCFTRY